MIQSPSRISWPLELTRLPPGCKSTPFFSRLNKAGIPRLWQIVTTWMAADVRLMIASISRITTVSVGTKVVLQRHTFSPMLLAFNAASPVKYTRADTRRSRQDRDAAAEGIKLVEHFLVDRVTRELFDVIGPDEFGDPSSRYRSRFMHIDHRREGGPAGHCCLIELEEREPLIPSCCLHGELYRHGRFKISLKFRKMGDEMIYGREELFDRLPIVESSGFDLRGSRHHFLAENIVGSLEFDSSSRLRVAAADDTCIRGFVPNGADHFLQDQTRVIVGSSAKGHYQLLIFFKVLVSLSGEEGSLCKWIFDQLSVSFSRGSPSTAPRTDQPHLLGGRS